MVEISGMGGKSLQQSIDLDRYFKSFQLCTKGNSNSNVSYYSIELPKTRNWGGGGLE